MAHGQTNKKTIRTKILHEDFLGPMRYTVKTEAAFDDELASLIRDRKESRPHRGICPRCAEHSKVNARFPYCMECGWDCLSDPSWGHDE